MTSKASATRAGRTSGRPTGSLRGYANEIISVTGALSGSFVNFGPIEVLPSQHNEMVATLDPAMGTGDFAGVDGKFSLTVQEVGDGTYSGQWSLDIGAR